MVKHDNYASPCVITIEKIRQAHYDYDYYQMSYSDEDWCYTATKEEILAEIGEHLDLMKAQKSPQKGIDK